MPTNAARCIEMKKIPFDHHILDVVCVVTFESIGVRRGRGALLRRWGGEEEGKVVENIL